MALPLARCRIDREVHSAHEDGEQQEIRQDAEHERRPAGRRRDVVAIDDDRSQSSGTHTSSQQSQGPDAIGISSERGLNALHVIAVAGVRAVEYERDARRHGTAEVLAE